MATRRTRKLGKIGAGPYAELLQMVMDENAAREQFAQQYQQRFGMPSDRVGGRWGIRGSGSEGAYSVPGAQVGGIEVRPSLMQVLSSYFNPWR